MSASFYLAFHLISLIFLVSGLTLALSQNTPNKLGNILLGISSLLIFIAGFGLIAKLGYTMTSVWIIGKLLIWAIIAISAPIIAKRAPQLKGKALAFFLGLLSIAVILAVIKPN